MLALDKHRSDVNQPDQSVCPICSLPFSVSEIEQHVDKCLQASQASSKHQSTRQPISKPVFALMKDTQLRKILGDFGLPASGDRSVFS